jgi:hypothetical protein
MGEREQFSEQHVHKAEPTLLCRAYLTLSMLRKAISRVGAMEFLVSIRLGFANAEGIVCSHISTVKPDYSSLLIQ